jgi:hypothetical protein
VFLECFVKCLENVYSLKCSTIIAKLYCIAGEITSPKFTKFEHIIKTKTSDWLNRHHVTTLDIKERFTLMKMKRKISKYSKLGIDGIRV